MRNRTVIIATNAYFLAGVLMRLIIDNGLQAIVVDNDKDLKDKLEKEYPKFIFIESCFHGNGTDLFVQKLAKSNRFLNIVVWTVSEIMPKYAARFIEAGANSFISLRETDRNVKEAISQISYGHHYCPADVEASINEDFDENIASRELTNRELEILKMAVTNKSKYEISKVLKISLNTIKTHKKSLFRKCGGNTILEVLLNGFRKGIITSEDLL